MDSSVLSLSFSRDNMLICFLLLTFKSNPLLLVDLHFKSLLDF